MAAERSIYVVAASAKERERLTRELSQQHPEAQLLMFSSQEELAAHCAVEASRQAVHARPMGEGLARELSSGGEAPLGAGTLANSGVLPNGNALPGGAPASRNVPTGSAASPAAASSPASAVPAPRLHAVMFGHFEARINGRPLEFRRTKSRELLALLIDRRERGVSIQEACELLWEGEPVTAARRSYYRTVVADLARALAAANAASILVRQRGHLSLAPNSTDCDLYRLLATGSLGEGPRGEYLPGYPWALETALKLRAHFGPAYHAIVRGVGAGVAENPAAGENAAAGEPSGAGDFPGTGELSGTPAPAIGEITDTPTSVTGELPGANTPAAPGDGPSQSALTSVSTHQPASYHKCRPRLAPDSCGPEPAESQTGVGAASKKSFAAASAGAAPSSPHAFAPRDARGLVPANPSFDDTCSSAALPDLLQRIMVAYYQKDFEPFARLTTEHVIVIGTGPRVTYDRDGLRMTFERLRDTPSFHMEDAHFGLAGYSAEDFDAMGYALVNGFYNLLPTGDRPMLTAARQRMGAILRWAEGTGWRIVYAHFSNVWSELVSDEFFPVQTSEITYRYVQRLLRTGAELLEKKGKSHLGEASPLVIDPASALYVRASGKGCVAQLEDSSVPLARSIQELEEGLADDGFVRVHRSYLVNAAQIKDLRSTAVELRDGTVVPLPKAKRRALLDRLAAARG